MSQVGPGEHVVRMRALAHAPDGPAREAGAGFCHRSQRPRRHELDLGRAVDVDELDQQIGDAVVLQSVLRARRARRRDGTCLVRSFLQAATNGRLFEPRLLATSAVEASRIGLRVD